MKRSRSKAGLTLWTAGFAGVVMLAWALESLVAEDAWWAMAVAYFPAAGFVFVAAVLLVASTRSRKRWLVAINAASLLVSLFVLAGFRLNWPLGARPAGAVRVLTYNVNGWSGGLSQVAAAIRAQDPDVILLQEAHGLPIGIPLEEQFSTVLPGYRWVSQRGLAVGSRLPIGLHEWFPLSRGPSGWSALEAEVETPRGPLRLFSVHFTSLFLPKLLVSEPFALPARLEQVAQTHAQETNVLMAKVATERTPYLVGGDFNSPPVGKLYAARRAFWTDAFAEAGLGFGYTVPGAAPMLRVDYLYAGPLVKTYGAWVSGATASDHRPVVADFGLP